MSKKGLGLALATVWLGLGVASAPALADGGTLRFSGRRGDWSITVFTAPTPLSAGPLDLSVLVLEAKTGKPITDLPVAVQAQLVGGAGTAIRAEATTEAATNKLLRAARLDLEAPGRWRFEVTVAGVAQSPPIAFDADVAAPAPPWMSLSLWIAWPLLPIALFAIRQRQSRRDINRVNRFPQK